MPLRHRLVGLRTAVTKNSHCPSVEIAGDSFRKSDHVVRH